MNISAQDYVHAVRETHMQTPQRTETLENGPRAQVPEPRALPGEAGVPCWAAVCAPVVGRGDGAGAPGPRIGTWLDGG